MLQYDWYTIKTAYSVEECKSIIDCCIENKSDWFRDSPAEGKKAETFIVETVKFGNLLDKFFLLASETNRNWYGYDLFPERPMAVNFNTYSGVLNEYPYHRDCNFPGTMCDSKLTAILNLSVEPYEGGEFYMYFGGDKLVDYFNTPGSLLIFPSFNYHKVTPVTNGKRITLSAWLQGPNFR